MTTSAQKSLILVDGSSYLYRAFFAMPPLTTAQDQPTGAVYGVVNMLRRLLKDYEPELMAVVFDAKGKTFRDELFEEYKSHRPPMPDEMRSQIEPLHQTVQAMGMPMLIIDGVEADDVIGTLATQARQKGISTIISTGDKDMAQLVDDKVTLINTMTNTKLDHAGVIEKFGIPPENIIDYLALVGDSSDNIPGVPKVGPKTAVKWLQQYGSLDEIIARADEIKGKVGESLRENLEQLKLSRLLATIKCDVELPQTPEQLNLQPPDTNALRQLFMRLEFKTWLKQLDEGATKRQTETENTAAVIDATYDTILEQKQLDKWINTLTKAKLFAFDTETTSLDYMQAEIVGVSFGVKEGEAAYVPLTHDYPARQTSSSVMLF